MTSLTYRPAEELFDFDSLPFGGLIVNALDGLWIGPITVDSAGGKAELLIEEEFALTVPGLEFLTISIGGGQGGVTTFTGEFSADPLFVGARSVPVTVRVDSDVLRPVKAKSWDVDEDQALSITLGTVDLGLGADGAPMLASQAAATLPRCRIGDLPVVISATEVRWCTPEDPPPVRPPEGFVGLYLGQVTVEIVGIGAPGQPLVTATDFLIGSGGISGTVLAEPNATWTGSEFQGSLAGSLFGFDGALTSVSLTLEQSALTACTIDGNVFLPYLDKVVGLRLGFGGEGDLTAVIGTPTCQFDAGTEDDEANAGPAGYILRVETDVFTLDVNRAEFARDADGVASVAISGRATLDLGYDLPGVHFQGLRIDTNGRVSVDGGWLDVNEAKSSPLKGFPFQITKIGFGTETDGRRWVGLNGGIKLADGLPLGASVEGLRATWDPSTGAVDVRLDGIALELAVPGVFSFSGKVAFFSTATASGFRGSVKLKLDTVKLTVDASIMIGRTNDGTTYFFLFLDLELPAGIPLFNTGAAIYGFAGLVATNLRPDRVDGVDWYHGYYRRPPVGVTEAAKWTPQRDAFAIGLGTTVGTLPDLGFSMSAKALLILVLPGPQLILQGKGNLLTKKPDQKTTASEGTFEALLVLDIPGQLFQANLAATYKVPSAADPKLLDVGGGLDVQFTWAPSPPPDLWHLYLGEKEPPERRLHGTLLKILEGDAWLMINRPGAKLAGLGRDEFVIGGSVGLSKEFDLGVAKAWFDATLFGQGSVSWEPRQLTGDLAVNGSAGIAAFGMSVVAGVSAEVEAYTPTPWYLKIDIEVAIKIDLLLFNFQRRAHLPLEFGDKNQPLPEPATSLAALHADHDKADEARPLAGTVPPDFRPLVTFARPVADKARFGSPGQYSLAPEDLGRDLRHVSYQLRHVVLTAGTPARLVGAAGEATVSGTTITFDGLTAADGFPALGGANLELIGDAGSRGTFPVTGGSGTTAMLGGSPPPGIWSYRLTAPRPEAQIQFTAVVSVGVSGQAAGDLASPLSDPGRFRGGEVRQSTATWFVLDATATTLRFRTTGSSLPAVGTATVRGPAPSELRAAWAPTGSPPKAPESATRLMVWARTPFAFFRHNVLDSVKGFDAFTPGYACGPEVVESPICLRFPNFADGPLGGSFTTEGVAGHAAGEVRVASHAILLGQPPVGASHGTVTLLFDPPVDAVWVHAAALEFGRITVRRDGAAIGQAPLGRKARPHHFSGGIDEVEVTGSLAVVTEVCYVPGWSCIVFDEQSFPQESSGVASYAGVGLHSAGVMRVTNGVLEVDPATVPIVPEWSGGTLSTLESATTEPILVTVRDLVEPVATELPGLGPAVIGPYAELTTSPGSGYTIGRIWSGGAKALMASVTVVFPQPATRVRVKLRSDAEVIAFADSAEVARSKGLTGDEIALAADPNASAHIGWLDRVLIVGPAQVRIAEVCTDAGAFGWARYEQWTWRTGVRRSVESMYHPGEVLPPDSYTLRTHTTTVITGKSPEERNEKTTATFTVGPPPGLTAPAQPETGGFAAGTYPQGGPLGDLAPYVERTMPSEGERPFYRRYDTAVRFNESYVTRMFLEAGRELSVSVIDAGGRALRSTTRHVWGGTDSLLDAWTTEFVRTLNGDGNDPCAEVDLDKVVRPESVTAGAGEPLAPARLHVSQLRAKGTTADTVVHRFEFVTSRFTGFIQHAASFDGRVRGRPLGSSLTPLGLAARTEADMFVAYANPAWDESLSAKVIDARNKRAKATTGSPTSDDLDAATAAMTALHEVRSLLAKETVRRFGYLWEATFGQGPPPSLPTGLRLSKVTPTVDANITPADVLLLESPEPIPWPRLLVQAAKLTTVPLRRTVIAINERFGRPDMNADVEFEGRLWHAGVELWVRDNTLCARADEPIDVALDLVQATSLELTLAIDNGCTATITTTPPLPGGPTTATPGSSGAPVGVILTPPTATPLTEVSINGQGVGVAGVTIIEPFVPRLPTGPLRISSIVLPKSAQDLDHNVVLVATGGPTPNLDGFTIRWTDASTPGADALYAELPAIALTDGQRLRLIPGRASAPIVDDALVSAGGPGMSPPSAGAVYTLFDPLGTLLQEIAAHPIPAPVAGAAGLLAVFPNDDGTRAFLVPPTSGNAIATGHWALHFDLAGDAGPDLPTWSVSGIAVKEQATLRFTMV